MYEKNVVIHNTGMIMSELSQALPAIELTPDEIETFPARLRKKSR